MKEGYKRSELGEIPVEWEVVSLGEIGDFKNGINKSKDDFGFGYPFVNLLDVFGRSIVANDDLSLVNASEKDVLDFNLLKGDVLFIRSSVKPSGVGLTAIIPNEFINTVYSGFLIRFRDHGELDTIFKRYCFYEENFRNTLINQSSVSANTNINQGALEKLQLPLPPLPEQQKIAAILSTVDEKIELIEGRIAQTQELKKGLMQKLLTEGIGHSRFKDSALGRIPESWEVGKLGEVSTAYSGGTPSRRVMEYYDNGTIPWVKSGEVNQSNIVDTEEKITAKAIQESSARMIKANSILVALYGATAGNVGRLRIDATSNQAVLAINANVSSINNDFIYHYLKRTTKELISLTQGSGQPNLSKSIIVNLDIPIPSLEEQNKIVNILTSIDEKLEILESKKQHFQALKKGLMQQLLTGRVRVG